MQHVGPTQGLRASTRLVKNNYAEDVGLYRIFRFVKIHTWLKKTLLSCVHAAPATADPRLATLVAALALASQVAQAQGARVQDDDNDDSFWALSESECLVAWEVAMLVALQGVKGGAWVLGWFRARLCPRRSPTGSYQPHVQTVLAGQHQVQSYRKAASRHIEQERLYGRQLFVSRLWLGGWVA